MKIIRNKFIPFSGYKAMNLFGVLFVRGNAKIDEHSFAVDLYKNPVIELTDENKAIIKEYTEKYFKAFVQVAINELLNI